MDYRSVNSVMKVDDEVNNPVEFLNSFNLSGFLPSILVNIKYWLSYNASKKSYQIKIVQWDTSNGFQKKLKL